MPTIQPVTPKRRGKLLLQVVVTFLPMAMLTCGAAYYFYHSTQERAAIYNRMRETAGIELGQSAINNILLEIRRDLHLVSEHYALKNYLDHSAPDKMRDFEQSMLGYMLNLASANRIYDQLRWLDETGMERVRINFNNGKPAIAPAEMLQDKSERYYFSAAFKLGRGEAYLSPLDLNIEQGRIEIPHKPMLRIAMPVFDSREHKRGIVIFNYFGNELLERFGTAAINIADHVMLLNQYGYWLKSPNEDETWGFMLGRHQVTLARRHPSVWRRILAAESGQFEDAGGLWTFGTVYPRGDGVDVPDRSLFWKAVAYLPKEALYGSHPLLNPILGTLAGLLLLELAGCWKMAHLRRLRSEAQEAVWYTNQNLERLVDERTAQLQAGINLQKQTEERLLLKSAALEATANAIIITDINGFIQWANPAFLQMTGYSRLEAIGKRPNDLVNSGLQSQQFYEALWDTIKHGRVWRGELINKRKDGSLYTEEMTITPVRYHRGKPAYFIAIKEDISARRQTARALHEKEFMLSESQRIAHVGSWQMSLPEGKITWSEETYRLFGVFPDSFTLVLKSIYKLIDADERGAVKEWIRACWKDAHPGDLEFYARLPDGTARMLCVRGGLQYDANNRPVMLAGTVQDITERKKTEAHLINLNRVYTVLSNINQAIVRLRDMDALFHEACRIAVEDGGFRMAWIGLLDPLRAALKTVAQFGVAQDYLDGLHISLANDDYGGGPTGTALREGRHVYCSDIEHDTRMRPWRDQLMKIGCGSSIAIPLKVKGVVRGVYNLYADQVGFFNDEEIKLLDELASDISFAMEVAEVETERRLSDERLRQAAAVFESTREGVMVTDAELYIRLVNRAFSEITGYSQAEVLGERPSLLSSGRSSRAFYAELWGSIQAIGHWQGEIWNRRKNGELYPELLSISVDMDKSGRVNGYIGVFADISKLKSSEAELEFLAHHDPLTRLPNRLLLLSRLEYSIERAQRENKQLALLMLDLDRFKDVNDSFGHLAGDELLQQAAARLTERLRSVDTVTRLGGDEFTVLLEEIAHPEDAARVADEIISALSEPWHLANGIEVRISVSVGITLFPEHGNTPVELLQQADAALYQAKAEGRGRFTYFSENLTRAARERIELESRLRRAITQNELRVYYQPQMDIASGRMTGAEALVRWQDPVEGLIPPSRFITVAEETGLIGAVGDWVLKEACLQGRRWIEAGMPELTLAVNVSSYQFLSGNLVEAVTHTLASTGFPAARLELELTESALMDRHKETVDTLNRLRKLGVRLAIDDFGTGYSSLAYLKRFPLDVLKIDKSFVEDIPENQDDREIAAAIIVMAHTLRFKVLAEGVETAEQLAFLQDQGCDSYQGFLKSPPLPADAFTKLLSESGLE